MVNGGKTTTINLSSATTIEDVLNAINGSGAGLLAEINADKTGINVRSREIAVVILPSAKTAARPPANSAWRTFTADTPLSDLNYGNGVQDWSSGSSTNASVTLSSLGNNNDLELTAFNSGPEWNNFTVTITNGGPTATPGITYDKANKKVNIQINDTTTASDVATMFANSPTGIQNDWALSLPDDNGQTNDGSGLVVGAIGVKTEGGDNPGSDFYITRADGTVLTIDISGAKTVGDVLDLINHNADNADGGLVAQLAQVGNGIELVNHSNGTGQLTVTCNPMSTAAVEPGPGARQREQRRQQLARASDVARPAWNGQRHHRLGGGRQRPDLHRQGRGAGNRQRTRGLSKRRATRAGLRSG